ncbi:hypothetical protein SLS61_008773 [Didymella pomorum]
MFMFTDETFLWLLDASIDHWLRVGNFDTPDLGFLNQPTLAKNESIPSVSSGILWPDTANKIIYAYGGEQEDSETPDERLWAHDVVYNTRNVSTPERILSVGQASWGRHIW